MPEGFLSIEDIIKNEPGFDYIRTKIKEGDIVSKFYEIFPDLKKIVTAVKSEKMIIYLKVENPAWRNELKFNERKLIDKINEYFGEDRIKYIKFSSR